MKQSSFPRFIITTLICIWIGGALIVATDVFILSKKADLIWFEDSLPTIQNEETVSVTSLRSQHSKYMRQGAESINDLYQDTSNAPNILTPPIKPEKTEEEAFTSIASIDEIIEQENEREIAARIEPAAGHIDPPIFYNRFARAPSYKDEDFVVKEEPPAKGKTVTDIISDLEEEPIENESLKSIEQTIEKMASEQPDEIDAAASQAQEKEIIYYSSPQGQGLVAIIIDDMGLTLRSKLAEILPAPITLSYLPNAKDLKERTKRAKDRGHEIMLHMPMEPIKRAKYDDGSKILTLDLSEDEFTQTIDWALGKFDHVSGINNHMGSRLTKDQKSMERFMDHIKNRNLFFIDSKTIGSSKAADEAQKAGIPYAVRDVFLDHEITTEFLEKQLEEMERLAKTQGHAIAIGHPHQVTIDALKKWIPTLEAKGLTLVPASALLNKPESANDPRVAATQ